MVFGQQRKKQPVFSPTFQSEARTLCIPPTPSSPPPAKAVFSQGAKVLSTWGRRCYFVWPYSPLSPGKL